jgi:hypothetical protein
VEELRVQLPRNDNSIFLGSRGYCGSRRDRLATASVIVSGAVTCLRSARASARTCVASSRHRTSQPLTQGGVHQIPVIKSGRRQLFTPPPGSVVFGTLVKVVPLSDSSQRAHVVHHHVRLRHVRRTSKTL